MFGSVVSLYRTTGEGDTRALGAALGGVLAAGDSLLITGDLGAGKSVFARGAASALGVAGPMPSPTFTLMAPYRGRENVYHFDLYRLADADEFFAAGLEEYVGGDGVALIEWPLNDLDVPEPVIRLTVCRADGADPDARIFDFDFSGFGGRAGAARAAIARWEETA